MNGPFCWDTYSLRWPTMDDYEHALRCYINVPDAMDMIFLVREVRKCVDIN